MRVLIIGTGFLGAKLMNKFSDEFEVFGTNLEGNNYFQLDICNKKKKIYDLFNQINPDIVIHTAALSDVDQCEEDRNLAEKININGTKNVVEACKKKKIKLIFISTDFVFNGEKGDYSEIDIPNPVNYYGKTKLNAEKLIIDSGIEHIIVRTSVLYGYNNRDDRLNFFKWVYKNLENGTKINVATDQINSPTLIDDIAKALIILSKKEKGRNNERGIFNIAGSEAISRFDFAVKIAIFFGFNKKLIRPVKSNELGQKALRPHNSSLNISKINNLGINMSNINEGLKIIETFLK